MPRRYRSPGKVAKRTRSVRLGFIQEARFLRQWAASGLTRVEGFAIILAHLLFLMKFTHLAVLSLCLPGGVASAQEDALFNYTGTVWADGADNGGWYDANKIDNNDGDADDNMCYAASASNLIAWWQDSEYGKATAGTPTSIDAIWQRYVSAIKPEYYTDGGDPGCAINWWISGVYAPTHKMGETTSAGVNEWDRFYADEISNDDYSSPLTHFDGYYFDEYGLTRDNLEDFITDVWNIGTSEQTATELSLQFYEILNEGGGISLSIANSEGLEHAITLWGAEYDEGKLVKLWLTDSDDLWLTDSDDYAEEAKVGEIVVGSNRLFAVDVIIASDTEGDTEGDTEAAPAGKQKIYFTGDRNYYGDGTYIDAVFALDASVSAKWTLVPEPTTATLSLLALAALAARRRRK